MTKKIVIIGSGPGGYAAAIRAAQLGAQVTVIEQNKVGGTCLNRGCIPSKIMRKTAEMMESFSKAEQFGISYSGDLSPDLIQPNLIQLMKRKQEIIQSQAKGILSLFHQKNIRFIEGKGVVKGPRTVTATYADDSVEDVFCDKLILATGTCPSGIPQFPFDGEKILSSDDALKLEKVPSTLLIIGGGVIGCEFAFIFAALGSKVTIVESLPRLLPIPSVDPDCSKILQREMKKKKINFITDAVVTDFNYDNNTIYANIGPSLSSASSNDRKKITPDSVEVEKILVCVGRKPVLTGLGLENIEIRPNHGGWIKTNDKMETETPNIYAVGDILGPSKSMLAHTATMEGIVAAENAMGNNRSMSYDVIPNAIFTMPEIANVGLTEEQASEKGLYFRSDSILFRTLGKAHVIGKIAGQAKIISDKNTGRILGVHIIGAHATDLIAEGVLAVQAGLSVKDLSETIHAHPTLSEIMMEVSSKAMEPEG